MPEDAEQRPLQRLMIRAYHSSPGPAQERATHRIPQQQQLKQILFNGSYANTYIDYEEWPAVQAPQKLIRQVFRKAKLPAELAERFIESTYELLMDVYHAPETLFPERLKRHEFPLSPTNQLCYFFCGEAKPIAEWVIAPLRDLEQLCGFILAADGSFFYNADEWNSGYGAVLN